MDYFKGIAMTLRAEFFRGNRSQKTVLKVLREISVHPSFKKNGIIVMLW